MNSEKNFRKKVRKINGEALVIPGGNMIKKIMILISIVFVAMGCEARGKHLVIKFDHIYGLTSNAGVIFEKNRIGIVDGITYTKDGNFLVELKIEKAFANAATEYTRFFIVPDPQNNGRKAIEMIQTQKGGTPLKNNAVVEGSVKSSVIIERMQKDLESGMKGLTQQFNGFAEELKKIPDSEAYKKLEGQLTDLYNEMKQSGKEVREMIQKEVLPRLEKELENLKKRFHEKGQEKELKPLEKTMEKIKKI
jgi:paraquat-inducible protein B